jgi:hypothetical protein
MNLSKVLFLFLSFFFFFVLYADIDDNWEAYYAFENGMEDSITGINGSLVNGASIGGSAGTDLDGEELFLDGTNDYANLRDFNPANGGNNFSISFWSRSDSTTQGNHCFIGKHTTSGDNNFLIGFWSGQFHIQMWNQYRKITTTEPANTWIHWVVTVAKISTSQYNVVVYKNGSQIDSYTGSVNAYISTGKPWVVGQDWDGSTASDFFDGRIDDIKFFSSILSSGDVTALYNRRYGFPTGLKTYSFWINDYQDGNGIDDLERSDNHKNAFVNTLFDAIDDVTYSYQIYYTQVATLTNSQVTENALKSSSTNNAQIVFFSGHGLPSGPVSWEGETLSPSEKSYSGITKWVFYDACLTLYNGGSYLDDAFNGNHVVFGFFSIVNEFANWTLDGWEYSEDMYEDFANTWVKDKEPMYEAWIDAIDDQWAAEGFSQRAGAVQRRATIDGKYFSGNYQRIYDTYRLDLNTGSFWTNYVTWGTPEY